MGMTKNILPAIRQRRIRSAVLSCFALLFFLIWTTVAIGAVRQDSLPPLPDHGVAGACVGMVEDKMLVAGGSWFPEGADGGKAYEDRVLVFDFGEEAWTVAGKLPASRGHGAAVVLEDRLVCIGGENGTGLLAGVVQISLSSGGTELVAEELPDLPEPMSYLSATVVDSTIYVAGGKTDSQDATATFLALHRGAESWTPLPAWPGPPRFGAGLVTQHDGEFQSVYFVGGKSGSQYLQDGYRFDIARHTWSRIEDLPRPALLAPIIPVGQSQISSWASVQPGFC